MKKNDQLSSRRNYLPTPVVFRLIKLIFAIFVGIILLINLTLFWVNYGGTRRTWQIIDNPILLPISICLVGAIFAIVYKAKFKFKRFSADAVFIVASLLFLILQVFLVRQYYFETAWDAATVRDSAINIVNGDSPDPDWWPDYYRVDDRKNDNDDSRIVFNACTYDASSRIATYNSENFIYFRGGFFKYNGSQVDIYKFRNYDSNSGNNTNSYMNVKLVKNDSYYGHDAWRLS